MYERHGLQLLTKGPPGTTVKIYADWSYDDQRGMIASTHPLTELKLFPGLPPVRLDCSSMMRPCDSDADAEPETTNGGLASVGRVGLSKGKLTTKEKRRAKTNANWTQKEVSQG